MPKSIWEKLCKCSHLSRSEQKQFDIIEAARNVFLEKGFDGASMDLIAETANVSKRTVYNHYASKEALFAGVMLGMCQAKKETMVLEIPLSGDIAEELKIFGVNFVSLVFDPNGQALLRILVANLDKFPELGQAFFDNGPQEVINAVADYFLAQTKAGRMNIEDPEEASGSFLSSLYGEQFLKILLTPAPAPKQPEIDAMVNQAVTRFLDGVLV